MNNHFAVELILKEISKCCVYYVGQDPRGSSFHVLLVSGEREKLRTVLVQPYV